MGLIDIINPLSAVLGSAVNESQQHLENTFPKYTDLLGCRESNPGQLGEKRKHYLCAMPLLKST